MSAKQKKDICATAIIVAAGSSRRMGNGTNKQLILIDGIPVLAHTLMQFQKAETIDSVIVVTRQDSMLTVGDIVREFRISKAKHIIPGGETRQDSVKCGLSLVSEKTIVAIHDGARPFVSVDKINELIIAANKFGASAPGVIPKDTVKSATPDSTIAATIDRNILRLIQTPQVFGSDAIKSAYDLAENIGYIGTDDCSIAEKAGVSIKIIDGEYTNIKVTTPEDIPVAEAIYTFLNNKDF